MLNRCGEVKDTISGAVSIALPTDRENLMFSHPDSIVICGKQPDMVRQAIEDECQLRHRLSGGGGPGAAGAGDGDLCDLHPFDAYQVVRLICHAMPVSHVCKTTTWSISI